MEELWAHLSHDIITSVVSCKAGTGPPSCNCINISVLDTVLSYLHVESIPNFPSDWNTLVLETH